MNKLSDLPYVYAVTDLEYKYMKIGITKNIKQRMSNIQSGCPFKLFVWRTIRTNSPKEIESYLHEKLNEFKLHGEWFSLNEEQKEYLINFFFDRNEETRKGISHALLPI